MKNEDLNKGGFNWNSILDFCRKNIKYISAGIVVVILVIVLAVTASNRNTNEVKDNQQEVSQEQQAEEFAVDVIPEINALINNYYTAYAAGDAAGIEACAAPVSELEKGYIGVMSQYITQYENIKCYTKAGLNEGEYAVSVVMDMGFEGTEKAAPGLDFFYVRTDENGAYYIDNLYSQFNYKNREQELDANVEAFITEYEAQEDVLKLLNDVQTAYEETLAADENLKKMIEETIPAALEGWVAEITAGAGDQSEEETAPKEQPEEEALTEEENQPEEESTETETSETASETVYATDNINIRKEPDESAEKAGSAVAGQSFTRTAVTEGGWSEIEYDGAKAYIKSDYVSTEKPEESTAETTEGTEETTTENDNGGVNYVPDGTVLTMNSGLNVRESMSETAERIGTTEIGDEVKVVLSYEEGWTKVEWNGKTGYIKTELLFE